MKYVGSFSNFWVFWHLTPSYNFGFKSALFTSIIYFWTNYPLPPPNCQRTLWTRSCGWKSDSFELNLALIISFFTIRLKRWWIFWKLIKDMLWDFANCNTEYMDSLLPLWKRLWNLKRARIYVSDVTKIQEWNRLKTQKNTPLDFATFRAK